jgi:MoxR-like ATPase
VNDDGPEPPRIPDTRDGHAYAIDPEVDFAVRVAVSAGRPLLLRGEPGAGKSSLAAYLAHRWDHRYYEHVVTSRTTARDLLWTFDAVRRLADAQIRTPGQTLNDFDYVEPGVLWWAFAPEQARRRGAPPTATVRHPADDPDPDNVDLAHAPAVVLIDEIDKADPDLPNGMLVPLGSSEFEVSDTRTRVRLSSADGDAAPPFIVITTNEERELPEAFLRRCVVAWVPEPSHDHLLEVARLHLAGEESELGAADAGLADALATELLQAREEAGKEGIRKPSTAEFLDALQALRRMEITVGSAEWERLRSLTLVKRQQPRV